MTDAAKVLPVVQVAFTALDADATAEWYASVLGYLPSGSMRGVSGPEVAAMMGLPTCSCEMRWLVDTSEFFQLEIFQFHEPTSKPGNRTPNDGGWSLVGVYVEDLDSTLSRVEEAGSPIGPVLGEAPQRRVCTRDPDGVWVELRERTRDRSSVVAREAPVTTAFARAVVFDLGAAREFFCGALGFQEVARSLHSPDDEALWGGTSASKVNSLVFSAGGGEDEFLIEVVQYLDDIPRPLPDDYRVCDQGLVNLAFGSRSLKAYRAVCKRLQDAGFRLHAELPIVSAFARYAVGVDDLSVELLAIPDQEMDRDFGFTLAPSPQSRQW